ncbi:hypothetical protein SANA_14740 [Gottschalkiaceae bacterium SANA]|nr:hypothetical protein SANA_14740 [Gottschalkiaceae bacterium SANA]
MKFLVIYYATAEAQSKMSEDTPEQNAATMQKWMGWAEKVGKKMIDFGAPLMMATEVNAEGKIKQGNGHVSGYTLFEAADLEEAAAMLKGHPHYEIDGCRIELHQCVDLGV